MIWPLPTLALCLLRTLILNPGLVREMEISSPSIPTVGSYLTPGISICSRIPKDRFPKSSNDEPLILDINGLCNSILSELNCRFFDNHRIYDYVFLCFFLPNWRLFIKLCKFCMHQFSKHSAEFIKLTPHRVGPGPELRERLFEVSFRGGLAWQHAPIRPGELTSTNFD